MEHTANLGPESRPKPQRRVQHQECIPHEHEITGSSWLFHDNQPEQIGTEGELRGGMTESDSQTAGGPATGSLSAILHDNNMSNEAVVEDALSWLLD